MRTVDLLSVITFICVSVIVELTIQILPSQLFILHISNVIYFKKVMNTGHIKCW